MESEVIATDIEVIAADTEVIATDTDQKREQRESAYVSRKRMWGTPPEPSLHPPVLHQNRSRSFLN